MKASILSACALIVLAGTAIASQGPSSSSAPYVVPTAAGVQTVSILTVGDTPTGSAYQMVGIPDGLGVYGNGDGTFTVLMNHELGLAAGAVRAHGAAGAFVSEWNIDATTLEVTAGQDLISTTYRWTGSGYSAEPVALDRLCSADLAKQSAFKWSSYGTDNKIFLGGEETRPPFAADHGRAWGTIASGPSKGESWELPALGKMAWENAIASPLGQKKTIVMCMDDAAASTSPNAPNVPSEFYMYVGKKQNTGNDVERAGLTNGKLYGMKLTVGGNLVVEEQNVGGFGGTADATWHGFGDVTNATGVALQTDSIANDVARMQRIEDGQFDPRSPRDFYFVTTASASTNSRLWRYRFDNIRDPLAGGTLEVLLDGGEGQIMMDNLTIDNWGNILIQEDPGSNDRLAKIWNYNIKSDALTEIATHNADFFTTGAANFLTRDEESSGIVDASATLGAGWFVLDVQAHYNNGATLVEGGQLLALYNPASVPAPGVAALAGLAGLTVASRRRRA